MGSFLVRAAQAHLYLGDYPAAVDWARRALSQPNFQWSRQMVLSSALAHQGLVEEAGAVLAELLERIPNFSSAYALEFSPMIADEHFQRMFDGLYIAGIPNPQGPGA
jgi:tetratricopeptide (TPR) repeat protein